MLNSQKCISILFSLFTLFLLSATDTELFKLKYELACDALKKGDLKESAALFRELISITPSSSIGINSRFMLGYVLYKDKKYPEAITQFNEYIRNAPHSTGTDWAHYYIGNANFYQNRYLDAAKSYLLLLKTNDQRLQLIARRSLENLLWGYLTLDELERLRRSSTKDEEEEIVSYYIVKRLDYQKATSTLFDEASRFIEKFPRSEYKADVSKILSRLENEISSGITVIVLLPFSGTFATYGEKMYRGIELAFNEYNEGTGKTIRLEKVDTKGDPLVAVVELKNALKRTKPVAIIGPLRSETAISTALVASEAGIPMISPSASRDGISRLGYGIFQLSPSLEEKCKALASYAINELGDSTFAILAINDEYGIKAGKSFSSRITELGGNIIGEFYYPEGTMDMTSYLDSIRAPLVKLMSTYTRVDSTDTVFYDKFHRLKPPNEWIVHIDGFFVPTYPSELENVLPQIPFRYIDTKFLGAIGWKEDIVTNKFVKDYIDGAVFVPDEFYVDTSTTKWKTFARLYMKNYPRDKPDRFAALGYDAASIVIEGIKKKAILPALMSDFIAGVRDFDGVAGRVSFNSYGASESVQILKVNGTRVVRVK